MEMDQSLGLLHANQVIIPTTFLNFKGFPIQDGVVILLISFQLENSLIFKV